MGIGWLDLTANVCRPKNTNAVKRNFPFLQVKQSCICHSFFYELTIHSFKGVIQWCKIQSCATITAVNFRTFHHLKKKLNPLAVPPAPSPPHCPTNLPIPLSATNLLPASMDLPVLDILCKWIHIWSFMTGYSHLTQCFQGSSVLQHVSDVLHCFL